jgi:hypothetical protein
MTPEQVVERERRLAVPAAIAAFAGLALYVIATIIQQSAGFDSGAREAEALQSFHDHSGTLLASACLSAAAVSLWCLPLYHLFRAAQVRNPAVRASMVAFAFIGPILLAAQFILAWIATKHVSDQFVPQAAGSAHPNELAERLTDDALIQQIAGPLILPAVLGVAIGFVYIGLQSTRVGTLTRFTGTLGMALGVCLFLIPQVVVIAIFLWMVFVGLIFIDRIPVGSRPPAWDEGEAIPWEPGRGAGGGLFGGRQEPASPGEDDAVETSGVETTPVEASPALDPPRERGERRKRKRRQ